MGYYGNELDEFIYERCYQYIWDAVFNYTGTHPMAFSGCTSRLMYPASATLRSMMLQFSSNISADEDELKFDATFSCSIELQGDDYSDYAVSDIETWITVSCSAIIEDAIQSFNVRNIHIYKRGEIPKKTGPKATRNIVPVIFPNDLDAEAERFLSKYCPEALLEPIELPIEKIAREKLGLEVLKGHRLTHDFSIFGQICFSDSDVEVYDLFDISKETVNAKRGTIFVDAYTFWERNLGCVNNTIAHEVFHWYRHRLYAAIKQILHGEKMMPHRCPADMAYPDDEDAWSDEHRMEWQANRIAPRILMPREPFVRKAAEVCKEKGYERSLSDLSLLSEVAGVLADFYKVSKQSVLIRLQDVGYSEAQVLIKDYYRPVPQPSTHIDPIPAFEEYKFNPRFQELIDSGLFCHINGYYVINDEQYIEQQPDGTFGLTEYAAEHIDECALTFRYITRTSIPNYEFRSGVFYRDGAGKSVPQYSEEDNLEIVERAKRLKEAQRRFAAMEADHPTPQTFWQAANQYMASRHWNKPVFEEKTGLGDNLYRDGHNHPEKDVSFQTAISVCAGLAVDLETSLRLLELAGYTLNDSHDHLAYKFILSDMRYDTLEDKNAFLESQMVPLLGSGTYHSKTN